MEKKEQIKTHHDYRTRNLSVSFSEEEYALFVKNVKQSGLKKTDYVRQMLTRGMVVQRINDEDRKAINQLSKLGMELNRLLGAAYKSGLENHVKWLGKIEFEFNDFFAGIKKK